MKVKEIAEKLAKTKWWQFCKRQELRDMLALELFYVLSKIEENTRDTSKGVEKYNNSVGVR